MPIAALDLTALIIGVFTLIGALITGGLLVFGPQRRKMTEEATAAAVSTIDRVRIVLESRLTAVESELEAARTRIRELEHQIELGQSKHRSAVLELELERNRLLTNIARLQHTLVELERRLPEHERRSPGDRRMVNIGPPPGVEDRRRGERRGDGTHDDFAPEPPNGG